MGTNAQQVQFHDAKSTDPWVLNLLQTKLATATPDNNNTADEDFCLTSFKVKERMKAALDCIESLKGVRNQISSTLSSCNYQPDENALHILNHLSQTAKNLKEEHTRHISIFEHPNYEKWKVRYFKTQRTKRWLKRKRDEMKEHAEEKLRSEKIILKASEEWMDRKMEEDRQFTERERKKAEESAKRKEAKKQKAEIQRKIKVLIQLDALQQLRAHKMRRMGQELPEIPTLFDILAELKLKKQQQQAVPQKKKESYLNPSLEFLESQTDTNLFIDGVLQTRQSTEHTDLPLLVEDNTDASHLENMHAFHTKYTKSEQRELENKLLFDFYNQAEETVTKLVEIRRAWDLYAVPYGSGGSRIPKDFVAPSLPSSAEWEPFAEFIED